MGLDIADDTHTVCERVGSYSHVQKWRAKLIEATLVYLRERQKTTCAEMTNRIDEWAAPSKKRKQRPAEPSPDWVEAQWAQHELRWTEEDHRALGRLSSLGETIDTLITWTKFTPEDAQQRPPWSDGLVNYRRISQYPPDGLVAFGATGLLWLVLHSDCDGVYSNGQCHDILNWLNKVVPHLPTQDDREHMSAIRDVFKYAVEHNGYCVNC